MLADAAAQEQAAHRYAGEQGFGWRPGPGWLPPQELRDAPWRSSLAAEDVWERFDDAVRSLSRARTGVSVVAIAQAFGQLSAAAWDLAEAVAQRQRQQRTGRAGDRLGPVHIARGCRTAERATSSFSRR